MSIKLSLRDIALTIPKQPDVYKTIKSGKTHLVDFFVYALIAFVSIFAWLSYYNAHLILIYNDARSHLNIARRIVDSLQPGFSQIGSVWLPLQHILELTTIWNDFMFRSGLSGSIVSMIAFVASSVLLWKLLRLFNLFKFSAVVGLIVFSFNPNLLYIQATPMTEPLMLCTLMGMIYFFVRWIKRNSITDLIFCGIFSFLGILTRYDGWFLFLFIAACIPLITFLKHQKKRMGGNFLLYSFLGGFAVGIWFLWNIVIFGDPFFFMNSMYSAKAQQDTLFTSGRLLTKNDIGYSTLTYFLTVKENVGFLLMPLFLLGSIIAFIRVKTLALRIGLASVFIPILFNIVSLYLGQSVIHLPYLPPFAWFNDRYGLMGLPAVATCIAFLTSKKNIFTIFVSICIIVVIFTQYIFLYREQNLIVLQDALHGASGTFLDDVGDWLHKNVKDEKILVASSSHDALIFSSGLPLKQFITEGMEKYWKVSLTNPTKHAGFIIMHSGDLVQLKMEHNKYFLNNYTLVYDGEFSDVYKRNTSLK